MLKDEDLDNEHLMKWNGIYWTKHRQINTIEVYATVLVNNYAIWSNNYQSNMFEGTSDAVTSSGTFITCGSKYFKYKTLL